MLTIQTVKAGKHDFKPNSFCVGKNDTLRGTVMFWPSCRYELDMGDQADWNKVCGLSYDIFSNFRDTQMLGWRYNPETDKIELNHYCHIDRKRVMGPVLMSVNINQRVAFELSTDRENRTIRLDLSAQNKDSASSEYRYKSFGTLTRRLGAWFGGNRPAPHEMSFELHLYS